MAFRVVFSLLRVLLPAWVGAAVLFAINGSAEQRFEDFDRLVRDQLAQIRFPAYYAFGFSCVGVCLVLTIVALIGLPALRRRLAWCLLLLVVVLALMLWDYFVVYGPLNEMLQPLGSEKTSAWKRLHGLSMLTNLVHVSLSLITALILVWPQREAHTAANVLEPRMGQA
jgi:hypothetical protein